MHVLDCAAQTVVNPDLEQNDKLTKGKIIWRDWGEAKNRALGDAAS